MSFRRGGVGPAGPPQAGGQFRPASPARARRPAPPLPSLQYVSQLRDSVQESVQQVPQVRYQAAVQEFDRFDADHSGSISKGEAKEFLLDELQVSRPGSAAPS